MPLDVNRIEAALWLIANTDSADHKHAVHHALRPERLPPAIPPPPVTERTTKLADELRKILATDDKVHAKKLAREALLNK